MCPKDKVFRAYIELELQLGEVDRCRKLYAKYVQFAPHNSTTWCRFAELERGVGEDDRARSIFELAVQQPLDMPDVRHFVSGCESSSDALTVLASNGNVDGSIFLYNAACVEDIH